MSATPKPTPAPAPSPEGAPAPRRGRRGLLLAVIAVVLLGASGATAWVFRAHLPWVAVHAGRAATAAEPPVKVKAIVPLGTLVVNLGAPEARRYLKVTIQAGVPREKDAKEIEERKAQILDLLLGILTSARLDGPVSGDTLGRLKTTALERIRGELHLERVAQVYITEFVIH